MAEQGNKPADNKAAPAKAADTKPAETKATETKAAPTKAAKAKVAALKVSSASEGFRRGGQVFGREPRIVLLSELSKEQVAQIKEERSLAVSEVEVDAAE